MARAWDLTQMWSVEGWSQEKQRQYLMDEIELGDRVAEEFMWAYYCWPQPPDYTLLWPFQNEVGADALEWAQHVAASVPASWPES